jgi:hypothetical protein
MMLDCKVFGETYAAIKAGVLIGVEVENTLKGLDVGESWKVRDGDYQYLAAACNAPVFEVGSMRPDSARRMVAYFDAVFEAEKVPD